MSASDSALSRLALALKSRHGGTAGAVHALASDALSARFIRSRCEERGATDLGDALRLALAHPDDAEFFLEAAGNPDVRLFRLLARAAAEDRASILRTTADWMGRRLDVGEALRRKADPALACFWINDTGLHHVPDLVQGVCDLWGMDEILEGDLITYAVQVLGWVAVMVPFAGPARADLRLSAVIPEALACLIDRAPGLCRNGLVIAHELEIYPALHGAMLAMMGPRLHALVIAAQGGAADGVESQDATPEEFADDPLFGPVLEAWRMSGGRLTQGLAERLTQYSRTAMFYEVDRDKGVVASAIGSDLPLLYGATPGEVLFRPITEAPMPNGYTASVGSRQARAMGLRAPVVRRLRCRDRGNRPVRYTNAMLPLLSAEGQVTGLFGLTGHLHMAGAR